MSSSSDRIGNAGRMGMFLSLLCAVHCAAMPLLVGVLPFIGLSAIATPAFEITMIGMGLALGFYSVVRGYLHLHGKTFPLLILSTGALVIFMAHTTFPHELEPVFMVFGASLLALAQILNLRLVKRVQSCTCAA